VDANWNVFSTNDTVKLTATDTNAVLPANGRPGQRHPSFTVTNGTAGSWTLTASNVTHTAISPRPARCWAVSAGVFAKLQLLVPGETARPGATTGKPARRRLKTPTIHSPCDQRCGCQLNLINTASDSIGIRSTDTNAVLPAMPPWPAAPKLSVSKSARGYATVTATDVTDGAKAPTPVLGISVAPEPSRGCKCSCGLNGRARTATGTSGAPSAQTAGAAFNVTIRATDAVWNLISTNDTVAITSSDSTATLPANAA